MTRNLRLSLCGNVLLVALVVFLAQKDTGGSSSRSESERKASNPPAQPAPDLGSRSPTTPTPSLTALSQPAPGVPRGSREINGRPVKGKFIDVALLNGSTKIVDAAFRLQSGALKALQLTDDEKGDLEELIGNLRSKIREIEKAEVEKLSAENGDEYLMISPSDASIATIRDALHEGLTDIFGKSGTLIERLIETDPVFNDFFTFDRTLAIAIQQGFRDEKWISVNEERYLRGQKQLVSRSSTRIDPGHRQPGELRYDHLMDFESANKALLD